MNLFIKILLKTMSKEDKTKRTIESLRKTAKRHRAIFAKARKKAEELEQPFLLRDAKKVYEGKFYHPSPEEWLCCQTVLKAERMNDRIDITSVLVQLGKNRDGHYYISITETDMAELYLKNEIPRNVFTDRLEKAISDINTRIASSKIK